MSHLVFEVLQAKIEKNSKSIYMHKYFFFLFFFTDFVYQYTCINTLFFVFLTDLSGTGQKRKNLHEHIGNLDRLSKKGRKVIGYPCSLPPKAVDQPISV